MDRKDFLRSSTLTALALATTPSGMVFANKPAGPKVRMAIIGTGLRGQGHLGLLLRRDDVDLVAICDIDDYMLSRSKDRKSVV